MKSRRVTILRKGLLVLALPLLFQALFIGVLLKRQSDHNQAQRWAGHSKDVLIETDHIHRLLLTTQSNLRGYLLTEKELFAEAIFTQEAELAAAITTLDKLVQDDPKQQQRLQRILERVKTRLEDQRGAVAKMRTIGRDAVIAEVQDLKGKKTMDGLSREIEAFRKVEERLDQERLDELQRSSVLQNWLLIGGLVLNLTIGALAAAMFSREIGRRIEILAENTRRIARGKALPPVVPGTDEISELDKEFHSMAANLSAGQRRERVYQETLEHRAAELTRANHDLDQKNQEIEMFVYSVSHDLRSPLVNLQGFSQELGHANEELKSIVAAGPEAVAGSRTKVLIEREITESIHYIQTAVTRLSGIIDALLRLSRAGRVEYHPRMVEVAPMVARIVAAMRGSITERGAEMTIRSLPPVWADPTALEQVFANLIGNAVNYLDPARPGKIEIGTIERTVERMEKPLVYFVRDNGLGIAEAYLPKVFAIFQRLHGSVAAGEGVGLALVRRMIERHGGRVWVESVAGEGATFFVALPSQESSPLAIVAPRKESISVAHRAA